jgi:hypothetical protein
MIVQYLGCIDWYKRYDLAMADTSISQFWVKQRVGNVLYHSVKSLLALFYKPFVFAFFDVEASKI